MITTTAEFQEQVRVLKLERLENQLVKLVKPCVFVTLTPLTSEDSLPLGASRFGGNPDLPKEFAWKTYDDGKPLTFLAQLRLSEITVNSLGTLLPQNGWLYFFYAVDSEPWGSFKERDGWAVVYVEDENIPLVRTSHPVAQGKWTQIKALPPHNAAFVAGLSLPVLQYGESERYEIRFESDDEEDAYGRLMDALQPTIGHQIGGYPQSIQYDVEYDCVVNSEPSEKRQQTNNELTWEQSAQVRYSKMQSWQFLLQIDTDDSLKVMWGDVGMLYVCIPTSSLVKRQFGDCWTILQCT